jgi:hypothetical protein
LEREEPMITASNIHYELADRVQGLNPGGIGAMLLLARRIGLIRDIDHNLHLLKYGGFWCYDLPHKAMFNDQANADELVRFVNGVGDGELGEGRAAYKPAGQPKYPQSLVLKR